MSGETHSTEFTYTYSASEQEEIRAMREKYLPKEEKEDKMEILRRLDRSVTKKGTVVSLIIGIIGALIMGGGMSLCMVNPDSNNILIGILIGIVGIVTVSLNYPLYVHITKRERERIAPEILRISEELLK